MYENGKEIAEIVREVRTMLSHLWDGMYYEMQVGDLLLTVNNRKIVCEGTTLCVNEDHGGYWILPPRDTLPLDFDGFLHIIGMRQVWGRVEMYFLSGHEIGKCDDQCIHTTTLGNCRTQEMRERMARELEDLGEDE